jgi:hypothetical protein
MLMEPPRVESPRLYSHQQAHPPAVRFERHLARATSAVELVRSSTGWSGRCGEWTPLVTTPPVPDHDSAHAVEGAAAAEVFRRFFRTDRMSFEACSLTLPEGQQCDDATPVLRSFDRFSDAADENGESRVLVGFHFRHAVDDGVHHGKRIADRAVGRFLRPVSGCDAVRHSGVTRPDCHEAA